MLCRPSLLCLMLLLALLASLRPEPAGAEDSNMLLLSLPAMISGSRQAPIDPSLGHAAITSWQGTATCLQCHGDEGRQMFSSVHYQWLGRTPYMDDGPDLQGKLDVGVNSYCINITGNWMGCAACHTGLGQRPGAVMTRTQLENIDCLICHQENYARKRSGDRFVPDPANMSGSMVTAARTVHEPTRATCLQCHARGGGGDNYKRGDLALAHASTADRNFDVHMATTGADLSCQDCHHTEDHAMAGRGSDLRPTELDRSMECTGCHDDSSRRIHDSGVISTHLARVACQTCHIPEYARNAADTAASEQTETHRDWRLPHPTASGAIHPTPTLAGNLRPEYAWWNGRSTSYLLYEQAAVDPATGRIPTSRPSGDVRDPDARLYPFKYKTATQPLATGRNQLIALDTSVYFSSGDAEAAVAAGLENMGYSPGEAWSWVNTDTYQLITHEVMPAAYALRCGDCHDSTTRMDLQGSLGYALKGPRSVVCTQCHGQEDGEDGPGYRWVHDEHVDGERIDCSMCHSFSRPERNLRTGIIDDD